MLRGEICISDWGGPVFQYIDTLVNSENPMERFDFNNRPEFNTEQLKKQYIKNLLGLWNSQELVKQKIKAKIGKEYIIQQFPTAQELYEFSLQFGDTKELKLNDSTALNKVSKIVTSLGKGQFGSSVAQILQDLGLFTEGKAFRTMALKTSEFAEKANNLAKKFNIEILEDENKVLESIKKEDLEKAQINPKMVDAMTATQMMNIENSDVFILYVPAAKIIDENGIKRQETAEESYNFGLDRTIVKYASFLGKDILINPTADEIRKLLYKRQQNNQESSVYIEEFTRPTISTPIYNAQINYFAHEIFDAFYNPYTPQDSISATNVTSEFWNTATKLHYQNRKILDSIMDPKTRRSRVNYISHMFSQTLTKLIKEKIDELEHVKQSDSFGVLTKKQADKILNQIDMLKDPDNGRMFYLYHFGGPRNVFKHILKDSIYLFSLPDNATEHQIRQYERMKNAYIKKFGEDRYNYISDEFRKMREYFTLFAEEAATTLSLTEHIMIDFTDKDLEKFQEVNRTFSYDDDENGNVGAEDAIQEGINKEESLREGWMSKFHEISSFDTLSKVVRQLLNNIKRYQYDDEQQKYVVAVDDIGRPIYLDQNYAHAVLIDILHNIYDSKDILPTLEKAKIGMPWIQGVIDAMDWERMQRTDRETDIQFNTRRNNAAQLFNAFAHDMNKYFIPYWIQTSETDENGRTQWKTVAVNKPEGTYYLLDQWRDNYESGIKLSLAHSVYNERGEVDKNQAEENWKTATSLAKDIQNLANRIRSDKSKTFREHLEDPESKKVINTLIDLMRSVGINTEEQVIISSILQKPDGDNLKRINNALTIIFHEIYKEHVTNKDLGNGLKKLPDLINELGKQYNSIADLINKVSDDALESSVRQGDKTYYAHTTPSYWGNLIKELQDLQDKPLSEAEEKGWIREYNSMPEDFKAVFEQPKTYFEYNMFHKYAKYDWFFHVYRNNRDELVGEWMNGWLEKLYKGDIRSEEDAEQAKRKFRDELKHKVLLQAGGQEYGDWSRKQHGIVLLNEFNSEPIENGKITFSYYDIPILADADSCEFVRFERFTNKNNYYKDRNGNQLDYKDILFDKFTTLVIQEYNRIKEVENRAKAFKKGTLNESQRIQYYDDSSVEKQDARGRQFTFLPALNDYKEKSTGKSFYENLDELVKSGNKTEAGNYIKSVLREVLQNDLMDDFQTYVNLGIYDVNQNGKGINIHDLSEETYKYKVTTPDGKEITKVGSIARRVLDLTSAKNLERNYKFILDTPNGENLPIPTELGMTISEIRRLANQVVQLEDKDIYRPLIVNEELLNQLYYLTEEYVLNEDRDIAKLPEEQKHPNRTEELVNELLHLLDYHNLKSYQMHEEFFLNSEYAKSQFVQITCTDYAFFKNEEDFCKRVKQIHAPNSNLNTEAIWIDRDTGKIEKVGKLQQKTIILKDEVKNSQIIDELKQALDLQVKRGDITKLDRDFILSQYRNITLTDGQAFRTLKSFRDIQIMAGLWTYTKDDVYKKITKGQPMKASDLTVFFQTAKPYTYTQVGVTNGLQSNHNIKVPTQHKDSEFVLTAVYSIIAQELGNNSKLVQLNQFMLDNDIDAAVFESSVKVGNFASFDFTDKAIAEFKKENKNGTEYQYLQNTYNDNFAHYIDYKDYGIQQETPEHLIDKFQLVGTQLRKLITQDMPDDVKLTLNGRTYTKQQWLKLYECLNTENILQSFYELSDEFKSIEDVRNRLLKEMIGNPRYTVDDQRSIDIIVDGNNKRFALPICDPAKANKIQALINSVVRKSITNQKINGGACIQVSNWGMTDDLNIRWYDENNELIMTEKEFNKSKHNISYNEYKNQHKAVRIAYVECYMPAYSKKFFKDKYFDDNGNLNFKLIEKENPNLLKAIGYRIPTENTYSMLPLKIKGFMPQNNGSTIMLPMDWVQISGSDFDVDKLYMMLKDISENLEDNIFEQKYDFDNVNYSFDKLISKLRDMTTSQRNNIMIDMIYEMLTNEYSVPKFTRVGNFKSLERQAEVFDIIENTDYDAIVNELSNGNYKYEKDGQQVVITKEKINQEGIYQIIKALDNNSISNLAKKFKRKLNPLAPTTQLYFRYQNTAGFTLVGIYANGTSHHALMQDQGLRLTWERRKGLVINGHQAEFLDKVKALDGHTLISTNMSEPQAASVDNIKNPVLARLNQNEFTANIMPTLLRLGYSLEEVNYFLKQPIVMEITNRFFNEEVYDVQQIIDDVMQEYKLKGFSLGLLQKTNDEQKNLSLNVLTKAILLQNNKIVRGEQQYDLTKDTDSDITSWYNVQLHVGHIFQNVYQISKDLSDLIQATKSDTNGGGAGPMISNTQDKIFKLKDVIRKSELGKFSFALAENYDPKFDDKVNSKNITTKDDGTVEIRDANVDEGSLKRLLQININNNDEDLRDKLYNSKLPMLQAFYTLGIEGTYNLFGQYFPQMQQPIMQLMKQIQDKANAPLNPKTYNKIYNALFTYVCSQTRFFGDEYDENNNLIITSKDKREYFITQFPEEFREFIRQNRERCIQEGKPEEALVNKYEFLRRLSTAWADRNAQNDINIIRFRNIGQLTAIQKERYMSDWESMLYDDNEFVRSLAVNLFRYSYYRNGFGFGPDSFMHLCPLAVKLAIKDYADVLQKMTDPDYIKSLDLDSFIDQLFVNNFDDYHFVVKNVVVNMTGVPDPTNTKSTLEFLENGNVVFNFIDENFRLKLNYDDYSKQDKRLIKEIDKDKGLIIPKRFFSVNLPDDRGNEWTQLYKLIGISNDNYSAEYVPVTDLGYQNKYLEYQYGVSVENMESVFWFNSEESYEKYISEHKIEEPASDNVQRNQLQQPQYIRAILDQSWKSNDYSSLFEKEDTSKTMDNPLVDEDKKSVITKKEMDVASVELFGVAIDFDFERSRDDSVYTLKQLDKMQQDVKNRVISKRKNRDKFASMEKKENFTDAQGIEKC